MNQNLPQIAVSVPAAGDGSVNGTSMVLAVISRARTLVYGHGAGDLGIRQSILLRTRPDWIDIGTVRPANYDLGPAIT